MSSPNVGRITQVIGSTLDAQFSEDSMPALYNALSVQVERTVLGEKPPVEVEYVLTPFGRRFIGIIEEVRRLQEAVDSGAISESAAIRKEAAPRGRLTARR